MTGAFADLAANLVAVVHIAYFLFIVGGMVAIVASLLDYLLFDTLSPLTLDIVYWSFGTLVLVMLWHAPRWPRFRHCPTRASIVYRTDNVSI